MRPSFSAWLAVATVMSAAAGLLSGCVAIDVKENHPATAATKAQPVKVVYHLNEGTEQASRAIGNIRNHLQADPTAKIIVVTHGNGINFLLDGANDAKGSPFNAQVGALASQGVEFKVCNNTLTVRKIPAEKVIMEASIVPSGVAEVARLQAKEGFVYLRP